MAWNSRSYSVSAHVTGLQLFASSLSDEDVRRRIDDAAEKEAHHTPVEDRKAWEPSETVPVSDADRPNYGINGKFNLPKNRSFGLISEKEGPHRSSLPIILNVRTGWSSKDTSGTITVIEDGEYKGFHVQISLSDERSKWLYDQLLARPNALLSMYIEFRAFMNEVDDHFAYDDYHQTYYFEQKWEEFVYPSSTIMGVTFFINDPEPVEPSPPIEPEEAEPAPVAPPVVTAQEKVLVRIDRGLKWLIGIGILILIAILSHHSGG
jgi:hypothetical protein